MRHGFSRCLMFAKILLVSALTSSVALAEDGWQSLFNGKDLTGWSVTLQKLPPGEDPDRLVQVRDGVIRMYADTAADAVVPFGVITHESIFSRFHLSFEYKWNGRRFAPRADKLRDAGVLYHSHATDVVWPTSVECQIQEGDTGDIVLLKTGAETYANPQPDTAPAGQGDPGALPENGGISKVRKGGYVGRFPELDTLEGWNRVELIVHADESAEHIVNGKTKARLRQMTDMKGQPLTEGKICLQLEGAELEYRDVKIRPLEEPLRPDRSTVTLTTEGNQLTASLTVKNPHNHPVPCATEIIGIHAAAFTVSGAPTSLGAGETATLTLTYQPAANVDRASAGLQIGEKTTGSFVILEGLTPSIK